MYGNWGELSEPILRTFSNIPCWLSWEIPLKGRVSSGGILAWRKPVFPSDQMFLEPVDLPRHKTPFVLPYLKGHPVHRGRNQVFDIERHGNSSKSLWKNGMKQLLGAKKYWSPGIQRVLKKFLEDTYYENLCMHSNFFFLNQNTTSGLIPFFHEPCKGPP